MREAKLPSVRPLYNWHRYYDPKIGRYVSSDPIGLRGGLNTYAYADNDPLGSVDPLGLRGTTGSWAGGSSGGWGGGGWTGNLLPGSQDQDRICTLPGRIGGAANSSRCIRQCCLMHDLCYQANGCNASSWFLTGPLPVSRCAACNMYAVVCVMVNSTNCDSCKE